MSIGDGRFGLRRIRRGRSVVAMKPLACIRHQGSAPLGIIEDVLRERDLPWRYVDAWSSDGLPDVSEVSGLIVLGGEMNADDLDGYPFLQEVRSLVRSAVDAEVPVLGVCLGAQVLTRALGARVRPAPVREIGFLPVKATDAGMDDGVLAAFTPAATVFQFHEDECELPAGAELLLEGEDVRVQAFRAGPSAYGVQFHFEVTPEIVAAWCDEVPDLEQGWGRSKEAVVAEAERHLDAQTMAGRQVARAFLELVRST
jgi:GMP synthase (glutamine-hydrolysing)